MLGRVKLDNTLLTCDHGNFNQITARSRNRTLVTVVRDTCTTIVTRVLRTESNGEVKVLPVGSRISIVLYLGSLEACKLDSFSHAVFFFSSNLAVGATWS